jgi:hypothetical protein
LVSQSMERTHTGLARTKYRKIFGLKTEQVKEHRKCNITNLHTLPNITQVIKRRGINWVGHVVRMGSEIAYKILTAKPRCENADVMAFKIILRGTRCKGVDWN